jgi:hypothetical protein
MFSPFSMGGLPIQEWLVYGIGALGIVVCLGVIARALLIPTDIRRVCCCGACGYAITDTAPNRCPECGGTLTKVGLTTPAMAVRLRGGLGWALLAWTVICGTLAQIGWGYVQQSAWAAITMTTPSPTSGKMQYTSDMQLTAPKFFGIPQPRGTESSDDLDFRIDADLTYVIDAGATESGTATLTLRKSGTESRALLDLDLGAKTFQLKDAGGTTLKSGKTADLDEATFRAWFDAAGVRTTGPAFAQTLSDCKKLTDACVADPQGLQSIFQRAGPNAAGALQFTGGGNSSSGPVGGFGGPFGGPATPNYWPLRNQLLAGTLGLVYVAGIVGIWWRRRRLLA